MLPVTYTGYQVNHEPGWQFAEKNQKLVSYYFTCFFRRFIPAGKQVFGAFITR
jgi:hypothetical protein